jgi:serine/threonine-protein kinase RsbW
MNLESQSWTWAKEHTFPSDMGVAHRLVEEVIAVVRAQQWNEKDVFALELILEEALTNAVKHGNNSDLSKHVRFDCRVNPNTVYVRVEDEGAGFDPQALPDPREPDNQMAVSGRGVLLIEHFATRVKWNEHGNVIELEKDRT